MHQDRWKKRARVSGKSVPGTTLMVFRRPALPGPLPITKSPLRGLSTKLECIWKRYECSIVYRRQIKDRIRPIYKKDSVQNYRYKLYTRLQQENKTRYKYKRNNRGDAQNRTNEKSAAGSANNTWATRVSGSQQSQETMTSRKTAHWEST